MSFRIINLLKCLFPIIWLVAVRKSDILAALFFFSRANFKVLVKAKLTFNSFKIYFYFSKYNLNLKIFNLIFYKLVNTILPPFLNS